MKSPYWSPLWRLSDVESQLNAVRTALMPMATIRAGRAQLPSIELQDRDDTLVVTAFLPGVDPQDVVVRVSRQAVSFSGLQRTEYWPVNGYGLAMRQVEQTLPLPVAVDDHQSQIALRDGAVVVTLQKARSSGKSWGQRFRDHPFNLSFDRSLGATARSQGQRLGMFWRQARRWLGRQCQQLSQWLLEEQ